MLVIKKSLQILQVSTQFHLLLRDKVHTLNMQAHCMLLNINSVKLLNEGQTPDEISCAYKINL